MYTRDVTFRSQIPFVITTSVHEFLGHVFLSNRKDEVHDDSFSERMNIGLDDTRTVCSIFLGCVS